jgi:hypothetical protein
MHVYGLLFMCTMYPRGTTVQVDAYIYIYIYI